MALDGQIIWKNGARHPGSFKKRVIPLTHHNMIIRFYMLLIISVCKHFLNLYFLSNFRHWTCHPSKQSPLKRSISWQKTTNPFSPRPSNPPQASRKVILYRAFRQQMRRISPRMRFLCGRMISTTWKRRDLILSSSAPAPVPLLLSTNYSAKIHT